MKHTLASIKAKLKQAAIEKESKHKEIVNSLYGSKLKRYQNLKELADKITNGISLQAREIRTVLTKAQIESAEKSALKEFEEAKGQYDKPPAVTKYQRLLNKALLTYGQMDKQSQRKNHKSARKLAHKADVYFEEVIEYLETIYDTDPAIEAWFDRPLVFGIDSKLGLSPEQVPKVINPYKGTTKTLKRIEQEYLCKAVMDEYEKLINSVPVSTAVTTVSRNELAVGSNISLTLEETIERWIEKIAVISDRTEDIKNQYDKLLYDNLSYIYVVYCYWINHPNKEEFYERVEDFLNTRGIGFNKGTSDAGKLVKTFVGNNASKASKYATHMTVAYNRGVKPKDYRTWIDENTIEMISRQAKAKPALAKPKPQSEKQSEISKARLLILTWLEAKEAIPIASGEGNCELFDEGYSRNSGYEISITKTRPHPTNNSKVIVDTLWTLPRTLEVESLFINKLAELLLPELDKIAARVGIDDLSNLRDQIENELYESALDKQYEEEYERIFSRWLDRTKDMPTNMSNVASQYNPKRERVKTRKRSV